MAEKKEYSINEKEYVQLMSASDLRAIRAKVWFDRKPYYMTHQNKVNGDKENGGMADRKTT